MRFNNKLSLSLLTAAGMLFGSQAQGFDEPAREGIVRITDTAPADAAANGGAPVSTDVSVAGYYEGEYYGGECCDEGTGCCLLDNCCCNGCWHLNHNGCCLPQYHWPDYGYARIVKHPIHRMPVQ